MSKQDTEHRRFIMEMHGKESKKSNVMTHLEQLYTKMVETAPVFFPESNRAYILELASTYARECAKATLERTSGKAKIIVSNGETHLDVKSYTLSDGIRFSPDRRGITDESNIVLL